VPSMTTRNDKVKPTMRAAKMFGVKELHTVCLNLLSNQAILNPSIGTFLNDKSGEVAKHAFLSQKTLADVCLQLPDREVPAHKAFLKVRSPLLRKQLQAAPRGGSIKITYAESVTSKEFMALVEYLYTDHCSIDEVDSLALLEVSSQYGVRRLVTLCELYITKLIDRNVTTQIAKSKVDVIGILQTAQRCGANQLAAFCLHFISSNFGPMSERKEWNTLSKENLEHVTKNRWPPLSYLKDLEKYEAAMKGRKEENCSVM